MPPETTSQTGGAAPSGPLQYEITWKILHRCNYRCTYCPYTMGGQWEELTRSDRFAPLEQWLEAWERIGRQCGPARIVITGGEPFCYPNFTDLVAALTRLHHVDITTNLSQPLPWLREFASRVRADRVVLATTFHPEFAELADFTAKVRLVREAGMEHKIYLVCYPPLLPKLELACQELRREGFRVITTPFRGTYQGQEYPRSYDPEHKSRIAAMGGALESDQAWVSQQMAAINPQGRLCHAGQYYLCVYNDGNVWRCGEYAGYGRLPPMGNLLDPGFRLWREPKPCEVTRCGCEWRFLEEFYSKSLPAPDSRPS